MLLHCTATRQQAARRMRGYGWSQRRIATRLNCSPTTVRRLLAAG